MLKSLIKLEKELSKINKKIQEIREKCPHPDKTLEKINIGDTGNYDPSSDRYYSNFFCARCGERWTEDQTFENSSRGIKVKEFSNPN